MTRWIIRYPARSPERRLLCLPHAGGWPSAYASWAQSLPGVEICAVLLAGRGERFHEPPVDRMEALVPLLADAAMPLGELAIFGHSMGALVGFELARELMRRGKPPTHLFASGCRAPHLPRDDERPRHTLSDEEFLAELRSMGGTPTEVLADRELMGLMLPALRADFAVCERYVHASSELLPCPIVALGGAADADVPSAALAAWREHTRGAFTSLTLPGDHFYLSREPARGRVLELVAARLLR